MEFEWGEAKNASNLAKHRVSLELATTFGWHTAVIDLDDRKDYGEDRFLARGYAADGLGYSIVFTFSRIDHSGDQCETVQPAKRNRSMADPINDDGRYGVPDDENPEMSEESLKRSIPAKQFFAERGLPMPGRPKAETPKVAVSLRLDQDVVDGFRAEGPGWQTRMNAVLAESLKRKKSA